MKIRKLITLGICCAIAFSAAASAQSRRFNLGKWTEIRTAILQELSRSYVDSLPVDRIERAAVDAMLEELDPYTVYIPEEDNEDLEMMMNKTYGGVGAIIYKPDDGGNVIINEPYYGSPAWKAGLVCGDEITAIDGKSVIGLKTADCSARMKGKPGTDVVLTVKKLRSSEVKDVKVRRERIHLPDIEYYGMLNDTTGYVLQSGFTENVSGELREAITSLKKQGMEHLVYDLRGNGGGILQEAVKIVSLFVPRGSLVVSSRDHNGKVTEYRTETEPLFASLPVTVLVNSGTASSSEIVSGALQDYDRALIAGQRTFGKGLVQSIRPLPYNGAIKVTTAKYYTPSGRCVQAIDYSHRNEDGSVGNIPDSLTHVFHTAAGREVRDGGGITPDKILKAASYSRVTYALVMYGITEQYALEYVRKHESIPSVEEFAMTDEDWEAFLDFASERKFDARSSSEVYLKNLREELAGDGLDESLKESLDAIEKAVKMDKRELIDLKRSEIVPFLEEEIVVRYHYQAAGVKLRLRYDDELRSAL